MIYKKNNKKAITFAEILIASCLLVVFLLPVFNFLTKAMKDTEKIYVECIALTRARQIMDTMMFQIPWKDIRESDTDKTRCYFEVPDGVSKETDFLKEIIPEIFGEGCEEDGKLWGDGIIKTEKGFWIRTRAKVVDLDHEFVGGDDNYPNIFLAVSEPGSTTSSGKHIFSFNKITSKDADGKYNLVKKIVVQVKWTMKKNTDPIEDKNSKSMFLVAFKSNIEG